MTIAQGKSLTEKLGIKKDYKVALISSNLHEKGGSPFSGRIGIAATPEGLEKFGPEKLDVILVWIETKENLENLLMDLKSYVRQTGRVWTIIKKEAALPAGEIHKVTKGDIIDCAKQAGLVENKIVSISQTEYALCLVVPTIDTNKYAGSLRDT